MSIMKQAKDQLIKLLLGKNTVPEGLFELQRYFRIYGPISFKEEKGDGRIVAISTNFKYGSIITSGKNQAELEENIKDATLTSFEVPSSYAEEAGIKLQKSGVKDKEYAVA